MNIEHVVVVGAGVAGLAAAQRLRAANVRVTLIEADDRIGGRAQTVTVAGAVFDHGASWLHDAQRNPLAALATAADRLVNSDLGRMERISVSGRVVTPVEHAAYEAAWMRLDAVIDAALQGPDTSLHAAMAPMLDDPWAPLVALWEGAIIAAADADRLSLQDWHRNRLAGQNAVPAAGMGHFITAKLAGDVALRMPATKISWGGRSVRVETPSGTIAADAAVITVSTGVLAAGSIRFDPTLPVPVQGAIAALPMGLLSKVLLPAAGSGRMDLMPDTLVADQQGRMTFNAWAQTRPHVIGFVGGNLAWQVSRDPRSAEDLARAELSRALGNQALTQLGPAAAITEWGTNPLFQGAYAYAEPGNAKQRDVLESSFPAERLIFAGEAVCTDGLAGTVGGAYRSGQAAASRLLGLSAVPAAEPAGSP